MQLTVGDRPPPYALGSPAANSGGFEASSRGFPATDGGDAGGDEVPTLYGSGASGGEGVTASSGGGYGVGSNSGDTGGGSPALPEARAIPFVGVVVVVAEPLSASRANNIATTTVPIWRAVPPAEPVCLAPCGVIVPSAPPLSPYFDDVASATRRV